MQQIQLNGFALDVALLASRHGHWIKLPLTRTDAGFAADHQGVRASLELGAPASIGATYRLSFRSTFPTRIRLELSLRDQTDLFHLIPGNIHGDNNAAHVQAGQFPCLAPGVSADKSRSPLWEFRADRASHPVSMLCCDAGAVAVSIDPYSDCAEAEDGFIRNGVFAGLPNQVGVSLGYGNDPLTFVEKTYFRAATADLTDAASAEGTIFAIRGPGRAVAHQIIRKLYDQLHDRAKHQRTPREGLRALADAFAEVNWSPEVQQYTNRACKVPVDTQLKPWRAIVEIGWTGGSVLAYPFILAQNIFKDLRLPRTGEQIFEQIFAGDGAFNEASGLLFDTSINRFTQNRPDGWNKSTINGWWSGFLPQTRDAHCAYTNAHAVYYLLSAVQSGHQLDRKWIDVALRVLDTVIDLQRDDGAYGYLFSSTEKKVIDWEGFAGCWFIPAMVLASQISGSARYLESGKRAIEYYRPFVQALACWGSPMDTFKSIDSEGNLAFIRAARLLHQYTNESQYLEMLAEGAHYEYLWRYGFRTRRQCPPLKTSHWNSCGGSITSVSNPHIHPMSVVATEDLRYLAKRSGDEYHSSRAADGIAWLLNTMELYPDVVGYGRYGVLSERTCPSDGLLSERHYDDNSPASTWWSYNAWAAANAMEALAERVLAETSH